MNGIERRIDDASFLWENSRRESAFLLVMIAISSISKLRYPNLKDGEAFRATIKDFYNVPVNVEYRREFFTIGQIFYKWIRCQLVHQSELPFDIQFQEDKKDGSMSIRAAGAPEYVLKLGTGWFFHFINAVLQSSELKQQ